DDPSIIGRLKSARGNTETTTDEEVGVTLDEDLESAQGLHAKSGGVKCGDDLGAVPLKDDVPCRRDTETRRRAEGDEVVVVKGRARIDKAGPRRRNAHEVPRRANPGPV